VEEAAGLVELWARKMADVPECVDPAEMTKVAKVKLTRPQEPAQQSIWHGMAWHGIASHRIASHRIASHRIAWHRMAFMAFHGIP
jgi:hypothetical protein